MCYYKVQQWIYLHKRPMRSQPQIMHISLPMPKRNDLLPCWKMCWQMWWSYLHCYHEMHWWRMCPPLLERKMRSRLPMFQWSLPANSRLLLIQQSMQIQWNLPLKSLCELLFHHWVPTWNSLFWKPMYSLECMHQQLPMPSGKDLQIRPLCWPMW